MSSVNSNGANYVDMLDPNPYWLLVRVSCFFQWMHPVWHWILFLLFLKIVVKAKSVCKGKVKGNGSFYIAQYPVRWTAQSALHFLPSPGRPVHSDTNSASPGSILARQQLRAKAKSLTFPPLSIARYSFIQLSEQGRQWRERKCPIFETVTKGIRTRAHLIVSPAFYRWATALQLSVVVKATLISSLRYWDNFLLGDTPFSKELLHVNGLIMWYITSLILVTSILQIFFFLQFLTTWITSLSSTLAKT